MPVPPGSEYVVTGTVTAFTSTDVQAGVDSASATITVDNLSPGEVTSASGTAGDAQIALTWTNPMDADFASVVILRNTSAVSDIPVEGATYAVGNTINSATVACVVVSPGITCTDTNVTNNTAYHYKIFIKDTHGNYSSSGVVPTGSPLTPVPAIIPTTTLGNGTDPVNSTVAPGDVSVILDQFTFITNVGADSITALTVTSANTDAIKSMKIMSEDLGTQYFTTVTTPTGNDWNFSGGTPISVTTSNVVYKIIIDSKNHTDLASQNYAVTGTTSAFTSTNAQSLGDSAGTVITVDNAPPSDVSGAGETPGDAQIILNWTNPTDSDFTNVLILKNSSAISDVPTAGTTYSTSDVIGSSNVVYVGNLQTFTNSGLSNGVHYYYKLFTSDLRKNYSAGTSLSGTPVASATVPGVPVNLVAAVSKNGIDLFWSAPSSNGGSAITDYVIEYQLSTGGSWSIFVDGISTATTTTVTGLVSNHYYDFRVRAKNVIGNSAPSAIVTASPGQPAQVIVLLNFPDLTVPSISTMVRITNEGISEYEYQYTWCVTDAADNLCGGGNDIFSSTAAKLISAGDNFDTTLGSIVPSAGNYYFHISVLYGSESSSAQQSFTAVNAPSGGGGSSPIVPKPIQTICQAGNKYDTVTGYLCTSFTLINIPANVSCNQYLFPLNAKPLKYGNKNFYVKKLQEALNSCAGTIIETNGVFGPKTLSGVKAFQKAHPPLTVDGIVGRATIKILNMLVK